MRRGNAHPKTESNNIGYTESVSPSKNPRIIVFVLPAKPSLNKDMRNTRKKKVETLKQSPPHTNIMGK